MEIDSIAPQPFVVNNRSLVHQSQLQSIYSSSIISCQCAGIFYSHNATSSFTHVLFKQQLTRGQDSIGEIKGSVTLSCNIKIVRYDYHGFLEIIG